MRIILLEVPPSLNQFMRFHWAVKKRLRERYAWVIRMEAALQGWGGKPATDKRDVKITLHRNRALDTDNAYGSVKVLIDAMRDIRLIKNDSPRWIELAVTQEACHKGQERTEIEVKEIDSATVPDGRK